MEGLRGGLSSQTAEECVGQEGGREGMFTDEGLS